MNIRCKIGTKSSTILRVKGKRKLPEKGEWIKGMVFFDYEQQRYNRKWKEYFVDDYFTDSYGERFYYLSL